MVVAAHSATRDHIPLAAPVLPVALPAKRSDFARRGSRVLVYAAEGPPHANEVGDNSPLPERLQQLTSRMLRKKLFLVTMTSVVTPDRLAPHLADHLEYMTELSRRGVLFASGPVVDADGAPTGEG